MSNEISRLRSKYQRTSWVYDILYSKNPALRARQKFLAPFVELVYGARFDRKTLDHIHTIKSLKVTRTNYLKADTYLLIEGQKI